MRGAIPRLIGLRSLSHAVVGATRRIEFMVRVELVVADCLLGFQYLDSTLIQRRGGGLPSARTLRRTPLKDAVGDASVEGHRVLTV